MTDINGRNRIRFGAYEADLHTRELWKFGTRMKLVGQPFEILAVLLSRPGELVTRDELREKLWPGETFVDFNHGLNAAVNKLRDVLSDSADEPRYIETLPRRGYRFIGKVERDEVEAIIAPPVAVPQVSAPAEPLPVSEPVPVLTQPPRKRRNPWPALAGVGSTVLLLIVIFTVLHLPRVWEGMERERTKAPVNVTVPFKGAEVVLVSGGINEGAQYSPDGKRLVFMSNRGGAGKDLWVSDARGEGAKQLTSLISAGTPRWSPDGTKIAFDSEVSGRAVILVVSAEGGQPTLAVSGKSNNRVPSWSHDGKYLYFASDRSGRYEVWRVPTNGGTAQQLTKDGGFAAFELADGKTVYYSKNEMPQPTLWRLSLENGAEAPTWPTLRPNTWASWGVAGNNLYFVEEGAGNVAVLSVFDLEAQKLRQLALLGRFPFWLAVNADGSRVAFDRVDSESMTSIVQLEDFR